MATYEENLNRAIRDAIAIDPVAGIHQLTDTLSKRLDHSFDLRYIKKLRDKVMRQNLVELDEVRERRPIAMRCLSIRTRRQPDLLVVSGSFARRRQPRPAPRVY